MGENRKNGRREEGGACASESELAESQRLAHVGNWSWDIATGAVTWSDETFRIFGLRRGDFKPSLETFLERAHPEDRERVSLLLETARQTNRPVEFEMRIRRPDGGTRILLWRGRWRVDERGQATRMYGTAQDITERRLMEEQLRSTNENLRALSARLQLAREEECARIAREIHDELGSSLTTLKWSLEALDKLLPEAGGTEHWPAFRERLEGMIELVDATIATTQRIASELRPSILDDFGLVEAIEWQTKRFAGRTGIRCRCRSPRWDVELEREQATALFRIFQEALTNVLRHARATAIEVEMEEREGEFVLRVADNGVGMLEEKADHECLGLLGMHERAHLAGGQVAITGRPGEGTRVVVTVPTGHGRASAAAGG
jgi:PAS domain S-box-containing protein